MLVVTAKRLLTSFSLDGWMTEPVKKKVIVGAIVGCLVLAAGITYVTNSPAGGIPKSFAKEVTWVKCRNPECEAEYQVTKKEYFQYQEEHYDPRVPGAPPMVCQQCGEESVYRAVKCEKCGLVFEMGTIRGDYNDRCPKCRYSKLEAEKSAGAGSSGG